MESTHMRRGKRVIDASPNPIKAEGKILGNNLLHKQRFALRIELKTLSPSASALLPLWTPGGARARRARQ